MLKLNAIFKHRRIFAQSPTIYAKQNDTIIIQVLVEEVIVDL